MYIVYNVYIVCISYKIFLPVVIVFAVQSIVTVVARLGQRDAARGTSDTLFVPAARTHSHQKSVHDFHSAAFATRRTFAAVAVC